MSIANAQPVRSIEGFNNNTVNKEWGAEGDALFKLTPTDFQDGMSIMSGSTRPNPRYISNHMFAQPDMIFDESGLSDFVWVFGQFIDHDLSLVESDLSEPLMIPIPSDDPVFPQTARPIGMFRSRAVSGTGVDNVARNYANEITAYLDGSSVYGSTESRAHWLRSYEGGKMKTSDGNLLPWNTLSGQFNDPRDASAPFMEDAVNPRQKKFIAGDIRANENPLLIAIHTLFVREHNRLCDKIALEQPEWGDEEIYQHARRMVGGMIQSIVYNEWLPVMGITLPEYAGYRPEVNAQISNVFSAAAFRMGHTLINSNILRIQRDGQEIPGGNISLRDAFFNPNIVNLAGGIDPYIRGMATQTQQKLDCKVIDDVRNFLFGPPEAGGLDLAAININRGRERGLLDFNNLRGALGLPSLTSFNEITNDDESAAVLEDLYGDINDIDPWVGMLAEDYMPGAMFGITIKTVLEDQFQRLRDGDRFFFENDDELSASEKSQIRNTRLRDVIMRNSEIKVMQDNVFLASERDDVVLGPELEKIDLRAVAFPNPSQGDFSVKIYADSEYDVDLEVYNNQGQLVMRETKSLFKGENTIKMSLGASNKGVYNLLIKKEIAFQILRVFISE